MAKLGARLTCLFRRDLSVRSPSVLLVILRRSGVALQAARGRHVVRAACLLRVSTVGAAGIAPAARARAELLQHSPPRRFGLIVGADGVVDEVAHRRVQADRPRRVGPCLLRSAERVKDGSPIRVERRVVRMEPDSLGTVCDSRGIVQEVVVKAAA